MFKTIHGNLITLAEQGEFDIIIHGANCFHCMGGGIAKQLADKYPEVARADKQTQYGDRNKLGTATYQPIESDGHWFTVANVYTQYKWSGSEDVFEYDAFQKYLNNMVTLANVERPKQKKRIGFPQIGAGLAGGDWSRISKMIEKFAEDVSEFADVTVVIYKP
jgi:O-acetyl-ADP-ribose deacetylase (regulator of RNase III)